MVIGTADGRRGTLFGAVLLVLLFLSAARGRATELLPAIDAAKVDRAAHEKRPFFLYQTALSPAWLFGAQSDQLTLFQGLDKAGLGGPSFFVVKSGAGTKTVAAGGAIAGQEMDAAWILASFAGSQGWKHWDAPWLIVLQKRPKQVQLQADGLKITFPAAGTGYVAAMPLYGSYKPPQQDDDFLAKNDLPPSPIKTWTWKDGLPPEVLQKCGWWASVLREFPVNCRETFSVDRKKDALTIRQSYEWISIDDDWKTPHTRFATLPHALAHALRYKTFPVTLSGEVVDADCMTAYGPVAGIAGQDSVTYTMEVLKYVNEMEEMPPPNLGDPLVAEAASRVKREMKGKFPSPDKYNYDHGGMGNFCWAIQGDLWYCKALPYADPDVAEKAKKSLRLYFEKDVLVPERYTPFRGMYILHGPGIGSWGGYDDAGKFSTNLAQSIWAYAQFTGDWELVKQRWDLIRKLFIMPREMTWVTMGRMAIAEMGDEAPPPQALARLAWGVGDTETYHYACYLFARELIHHYLKQKGAEYFAARQPYHKMVRLPTGPNQLFLTNLWGSTAGWQVDGLEFGEGERQSTNRWVRFHSEDTARFYHDHLAQEIASELNDPVCGQGRFRASLGKDDSHILPSFVRVRSLLLDEPPQKLAEVCPPGKLGGVPSGVIASCMAYLRAGTPRKYRRLIPAADEPSPFVTGLEREARMGPFVTTALEQAGVSHPRVWPQPTWHGWKTPNGRDRWTFGAIVPFPGTAPADVKSEAISWVSRVESCEALAPRNLPNLDTLKARESSLDWYVAGPFEAAAGQALFDAEFGPETGKPEWTPPQAAAPQAWTKVKAAKCGVSLLSAVKGKTQQVAAYASTQVFSPDERKAVLFIGSDDGVKCWLNGKLVHAHNTSRGVKPDEDCVSVTLQRGWNRVLLKITQGDGGWGFYFRIAHPDEQPFEDLRFSVDGKE